MYVTGTPELQVGDKELEVDANVVNLRLNKLIDYILSLIIKY